ncbi:MAG: hypothetical protein ABI425_00200 [Patescibacteria group bacterium]
MPAKRKSTPPHSKKKNRTSSRNNALVHHYVEQRDEFYKTHPRIRVLLGLLIVSFAMAIGILYYNKTLVYIGLTLDSEYGIRYPVVESGAVSKK